SEGRGGSSGAKFPISLGILVGAFINCADNTGAPNLCIVSGEGMEGPASRRPAAGGGDVVVATVGKANQSSEERDTQQWGTGQQESHRRKDGVFLYCEDNTMVLVMKAK
ncbi:unnamed protein product, partial [Gulo gulo]